jgi:hypothetical protein
MDRQDGPIAVDTKSRRRSRIAVHGHHPPIRPFAPPARYLDAQPVAAEEGRAMLRACFAQYRVKLLDLIRTSLDQTNDLFETNSHIPDGEVEAFRNKRGEWLERFDKDSVRSSSSARRRQSPQRPAAGRRRVARYAARPDRRSTTTGRRRSRMRRDFLDRFTHGELAALDLRVETLRLGRRPHATRDRQSLRDHLHPRCRRRVGARRLSQSARVAAVHGTGARRSHGEINKLYISLNRFLADRGVLPRSRRRCARAANTAIHDKDLFPTFTKYAARRVARRAARHRRPREPE